MNSHLPALLFFGFLFILLTSAVPCLADGTTTPKTDPKIEALIDQLTQVDEPGVGYSGDDTYGGFIPLNGQVSFQGGILGNPPPAISPTLQKIVRMGAAALPALIAHLTDARPTKVVIKHGLMIGSMWVAAEYDPRYHLQSPDWQDDSFPTNPFADMNDTKGPFRYEKEIHGIPVSQYYTVRVGDLCYGAIGQIVNRQLTPIRYQMTACIVVNSPVFEPKLAAETRKDWEGITAEQLKLSLISDATAYDTTRQAGALTRLCYYYPHAGIPLAVKLLQRPVYNKDIVFDFIDNTLVQSIEFQPSDIKNASKIATDLKTPPTALLRYLVALNKFSFGNVSAQEVVSGTLNVLMARPDLYDPSAFSGVTLRSITRRLLATSPTGVERTYLNRLLLEDAFAGDISHIAHPPDLSSERLKRACIAFGRKYGPAYSAGVKYNLYELSARAKARGSNVEPSSSDEFQWPVIFAALFPRFAPTTVPDAADIYNDMQLIESVAAFPSPSIDKDVDRILRTLSPTADFDGETDRCAVACVARLNGTKYERDCARFCAKRIPYLATCQAEGWPPKYEIQYYEDAFTGGSAAVDFVTDAFLHKLSTTARLDGDTDYCALSCIRRLRNTRYAGYCAQFCTERIAFLKSRPPSHKEYVDFFLPLYDKFLAQLPTKK